MKSNYSKNNILDAHAKKSSKLAYSRKCIYPSLWKWEQKLQLQPPSFGQQP